jgi:hypothetical protein
MPVKPKHILASLFCLSISIALALGYAQPGSSQAGDAIQSQKAAATAKAEAASWFKAAKVAGGAWCIDDHGSDPAQPWRQAARKCISAGRALRRESEAPMESHRARLVLPVDP